MEVSSQTRDEENDQSLIRRIQAGENAAVALLYDRYARQMLGIAVRILGNSRDAEDLLQDVFLEVWHKAKSYDPARASVRTWLLLRVRSRAIDRKRAIATAQHYGMAVSQDATDEIREVVAADDPSGGPDQIRARRALSVLPEAQRQVLELGYFEGLTYREIAVRCRVPLGTVKSRLAAALARLRQELAVST